MYSHEITGCQISIFNTNNVSVSVSWSMLLVKHCFKSVTFLSTLEPQDHLPLQANQEGKLIASPITMAT